MNSKKIKKLLETKRYAELTGEELRLIEEYLSQSDGSADALLASIEYDKMIGRMKNSVPVLNDPEELTALIMASTEEKYISADSTSFIDRILEVIVIPKVQFAFKALLVLIAGFYFYEEISFSNRLSNLENKYYTETVSEAGVESIIKSEISLINKLQNMYELIIDEKDYLELSAEWAVIQRSEQKRIIGYYLSYVLGDNYEEEEILKLIDLLDNVNFLDGLNEDEIKALDKHRKIIENEIKKISPGGESHE